MYATDSSYANKIINVIERFNLTRFDNPLPKDVKVDKEKGLEKKVEEARKKGLFAKLSAEEADKLLKQLATMFSLSTHSAVGESLKYIATEGNE